MSVDYEEGRRLLAEWERCYNYDENGNKKWDDPTEDQVIKAHDALADFLLTHAEALLNPDPWRRIEEAPKDGTEIFAIDNRRDYKAVVRWTEGGEWECISYYGTPMGLGFSVTHWMPIPHFRELKGPGQ